MAIIWEQTSFNKNIYQSVVIYLVDLYIISRYKIYVRVTYILYILCIYMVCKVNYNTSKREGTQFMDKN